MTAPLSASSAAVSTPVEDAPERQAALAANERVTAMRNGVKLGMSLTATWAVALVVKLQLPRYLGPARFGEYTFSESLSTAFICLLSLGTETYIQREIATRPAHASDFFGGILMLRVLLAVPVFLAMAMTQYAAGSTSELQWMLFIFGVAQFVMGVNGTLAAMLQASTEVNELATSNVTSKLLWGGGVMALVYLRAPLIAIVVPSVVSSVVRTIVLWRAARRVLGLSFRIDVAATRKVVAASLPFFVHGISVVLMGRLDVTTLEFLTSAEEVGWYGAASNFAGLAMLLAPVLSWIMLPLFARAQSRSEEEFFTILRRSIEGFLVIAIPVTLMMALGADLWIRVAFSSTFAPAAISLQVLAPVFVGTYLAMLLSSALITVRRSWQLTSISLTGLVLLPLLVLISVPALRGFGPGWAGAGAAFAVSATELCVALLLIRAMGRNAIDRRALIRVGKSLLVAGLVIVAHRSMSPLGDWRLVADFILYPVVALMVGAVRVAELQAAVQAVRRARRGSSQAAG
jgi:O-antigen/teichoic acid export membrane protein